MAAGSLARIAEMSAPTRASPRSASVQALRSSSLGRKESFDLANLQLRTSPRQLARSSVPSICFLTLAPSKGDVSSPSASSLNRAKMRASLAASSSVYDGCGGCGAPGSGRSFCCSTCGAALAEYQLLGALLRRVQRAAPRAALRRALADESMARPSPAVRRPRGAIVPAAMLCCSASQACKPQAKRYSGTRNQQTFRVVLQCLDCCGYSSSRWLQTSRRPLQGGVRHNSSPQCSSTPPTRETSRCRPRSYYPVLARVRLGSGRSHGGRAMSPGRLGHARGPRH